MLTLAAMLSSCERPFAQAWRCAAAPLAVTLLAACGGGGGSGRRAVLDPNPTTLTVDFPPPRCEIEATEIVVRGTATDVQGVAEVRVDGLAAASGDGFRHWSVTVPIAFGRSVHEVEAVDGRGHRSPLATFEVESAPLVTNPLGVAIDAANGRAIVSDGLPPRLIAVDLVTGVRLPFSDADHGKGDEFLDTPQLMKTDPTTGDVHVPVGDALLAVDRDGKRRIVSGRGVGAGPALLDCRDVVVDVAAGVAYVTDQSAGASFNSALLVIGLDSGKRAIVSDAQTGSGPALSSVRGVDRVPGAELVVVATRDGLIAIDLADGSRTVISDSSRGNGPDFSTPFGVAVSADGARALVTDDDTLLSVDLVTGDRTVVSGLGAGTGPLLNGPAGCVLDEPSNRLLVVSNFARTLLAVDLATGDRRDLCPGLAGTGDVTLSLTEAVPEVDGRSLLVLGRDGELSRQCIARVDLDSGDRTLISGFGRGAGPDLFLPLDLALDDVSGTLLVADDDVVLAIDPASGDRRIFSGGAVGAGLPFLPEVDALALLPERRLGFVCDRDRIASVGRVLTLDLDSGDRALLSDTSRGAGPALVRPIAVVVDGDGNRLLALDRTLDALLAIDLVTGDRVILSDDTRGNGPTLNGTFNLRFDAASRTLIARGSNGVDGSLLLAVDLATGDRTPVYDGSASAGSKLFGSGEMLDSGDPGTLLGLSNHSAALFAIDLATSTGVVLSQ